MTQQDLSNELNNRFGLKVDRVMISKWETGFQTPVVYTISCLAKIFGVSMDYLNSSSSPTPKHSFDLSEHESELIFAYRNHPDMQKSVDKLLGVEPEEKIYIIKKAARNGDNSPLVVTDSKLKELETLPEVPLEDG